MTNTEFQVVAAQKISKCILSATTCEHTDAIHKMLNNLNRRFPNDIQFRGALAMLYWQNDYKCTLIKKANGNQNI